MLDYDELTKHAGFMEGKPYNMEGQNGMSFMTDQYAIVAHGKAVKEWPFIACSDSKFTEVRYYGLHNGFFFFDKENVGS